MRQSSGLSELLYRPNRSQKMRARGSFESWRNQDEYETENGEESACRKSGCRPLSILQETSVKDSSGPKPYFWRGTGRLSGICAGRAPCAGGRAGDEPES